MPQDKEFYLSNFNIKDVNYQYYDIKKACQENNVDINTIPYTKRIILENILRNFKINLNSKNLEKVKQKESPNIIKDFFNSNFKDTNIEFYPSRILMQDFTGVPALVDFATIQETASKLNIKTNKLSLKIPVTLVVDHSVNAIYSGTNNAQIYNLKKEYEQNYERYKFLKWCQQNINKLKLVPPGKGICHQINLEYLAEIASIKEIENKKIIYPDTLVGTDSHTTMINGLSILGWGVGGIEAESAMLGFPLNIKIPEIAIVYFIGKIKPGITATDIVLHITEKLRKLNVVGKMVEFIGPSVKLFSLQDRATISNMAPEYGATCGYFPADEETIKYMHSTGRSKNHIELVEKYLKINNLWNDNNFKPNKNLIEIDLTEISPCISGPKRPQDLVLLNQTKNNFIQNYNTENTNIKKQIVNDINDGSIVLAAITSCTNTSNPSVMIAAGLLAKKAYRLGIYPKKWIKTSIAPGSKVVTEYLKKLGLDFYLEKLGFNIVGYGCTTCIGNSGDLKQGISEKIISQNLTVASILSGNRNFEGRIHPHIKANYLASPPLVIAYSLLGRIDIDITNANFNQNDEKKITLKDLWPPLKEIERELSKINNPDFYKENYKDIYKGDEFWNSIKIPEYKSYKWDKDNNYIKKPPYLDEFTPNMDSNISIKNARILAILGDSITTDHISPAGFIPLNSEAGKYLKSKNINSENFNSYGSRRGNHELMIRGTLANIRLENKICPESKGGYTKYYPDGKDMSIYQASKLYLKQKTPLVIFAGKEYGTGSSRDWAAKGTSLLGVKAVIAINFERIHRSNLIGMGVIPLSYQEKDLDISKLDGSEIINLEKIDSKILPLSELQCSIKNIQNEDKNIKLKLEVYTEYEMDLIFNGSILQKALRDNI